jgi:hypothetical protein
MSELPASDITGFFKKFGSTIKPFSLLREHFEPTRNTAMGP